MPRTDSSSPDPRRASAPSAVGGPIRSQVWLAGLVGGALGCAATAALLIALDPLGAPAPSAESADGSDAVAEPLVERAPPRPADAAAEGDDGRVDVDVALEDARAERSQLARTVLELSREVDALTGRLEALPVGSPDGSLSDATDSVTDDAAIDGALAADDEAFGGETFGGGQGRRGANTGERLLAAGLDPASAAEIQRRDSEWQLARLELIDRAAREGWQDSDELDRRLEDLDGTRPDLREELGEAAYDRFLFEGGGPNRVGIADVIPGSAAAQAGLQVGDVVMRYADAGVFRVGDLQDATRGGTRGESVFVEVERDGQTLSVQLPRGPLGVSLNAFRREP